MSAWLVRQSSLNCDFNTTSFDAFASAAAADEATANLIAFVRSHLNDAFSLFDDGVIASADKLSVSATSTSDAELRLFKPVVFVVALDHTARLARLLVSILATDTQRTSVVNSFVFSLSLSLSLSLSAAGTRRCGTKTCASHRVLRNAAVVARTDLLATRL